MTAAPPLRLPSALGSIPKTFKKFRSSIFPQPTLLSQGRRAQSNSTDKMVSFHTLERERYFQNPPEDKSAYPLLAEAVAPHVGSFNALTTGGLLDLAVKDIGEKTVFDSNNSDRRGNKLTCM
jgi:hypothetical protein